MDGLIGLMERVLEELREVREELLEIREVLGRLERRWAIECKVGGGDELRLRDLTEGELRIAGIFLNWVKKHERAWEELFKSNGEEGYDRVTGLCYIRKVTMEDVFISWIVAKGYLRKDVFRVLGDLGLLRYREKTGGGRQYCIRVSWKFNSLKREGSRYVVNWERVEELYREWQGILQERGSKLSGELGWARGSSQEVEVQEEGRVVEGQNQEIKRKIKSAVVAGEPVMVQDVVEEEGGSEVEGD